MQRKEFQPSFARVAGIFVMFLIASGSCTDVIARKSLRSLRQELGLKERLKSEKRLWDLGYWAGPVDGRFDSASRHALVAFQKVERRPRTGSLTTEELNALRNANRPFPRHGRYAHVEIDFKPTGSVAFLMRRARSCAFCLFPPAMVSCTWTMVKSTVRARQQVRSTY